MKKIMILAIPALVMTACTSEEDTRESLENAQRQEIAFRATTGRIESRNALFGGGGMPTENTFNLSAMYTPVGSDPIKYLDNQLFAYDPNSSYWRPSDGSNFLKIYYPGSGSMQFFGYSTSKTHKDPVFSLYNGNITSMEVDFENNLDGAEDVYYTEDIRELGVGFYEPLNNTLTFRHAMAGVRFYIYADGNTEFADRMRVHKIRLNHVQLSGKLTVIFDDTGKAYPTWEENEDYVKESVDIPYTGEGVRPMANGEAGMAISFGSLLLVAGNQSPDSFTVTYSIDDIPTTKTVSFKKESSDPQTWIGGKYYTYKLKISAKELGFKATVQTWDGSEDGNGYETVR